MSFVDDNMMDQTLHFETNFPRLENNSLKKKKDKIFKISIETGIWGQTAYYSRRACFIDSLRIFKCLLFEVFQWGFGPGTGVTAVNKIDKISVLAMSVVIVSC